MQILDVTKHTNEIQHTALPEHLLTGNTYMYIVLPKQVLSETLPILNYQKIFKSDHAWSFQTVPGLILREYWTSTGAMWLFDFSDWLSELHVA